MLQEDDKEAELELAAEVGLVIFPAGDLSAKVMEPN
jgi:hypothetical protein